VHFGKQIRHNSPVPQQSHPGEKPSGLGWPVNVSRETLTDETDEKVKITGLGWPT
jgi:hypothetical protein